MCHNDCHIYTIHCNIVSVSKSSLLQICVNSIAFVVTGLHLDLQEEKRQLLKAVAEQDEWMSLPSDSSAMHRPQLVAD